jgi:hypothetical protein
MASPVPREERIGRQQLILNHAMALTRMLGRNVVCPIDVVLDCADGDVPGVALARHGLTRRAILEWCRTRGPIGPEPSMRTYEVPASDEVEMAMAAASASVKTMPRRGRSYDEEAWIVAELVTRPDRELRELLEHFTVQVGVLAEELRDSVDFASARAHQDAMRAAWRSATVFERERRLVFVPAHYNEHGRRRHTQTRATSAPVDAAPADLGAQMMATLAAFGVDELPDAPPYWAAFKERARQGFERRARCVMVDTSDDVLVRFRATDHVTKFEYVGINTRQVCAPVDDPERIGHALSACVDACRG